MRNGPERFRFEVLSVTPQKLKPEDAPFSCRQKVILKFNPCLSEIQPRMNTNQYVSNMKVSRIKYSLAAALLLSTFDPQLSTIFAQGSLTPPGAPAPVMKSLDQIQPRTPIFSAPFIITNSGSYYLTTNLTVSSGDAIDINVSGVTLDLNGFTISSTAPSATGYAIQLNNGPSDVTPSSTAIS
jgi:hypothetical protein